MNSPSVVIICCAVLKAEVQWLCRSYWPEHKLKFLPSMLHMHPDSLASSLEPIISAEVKHGHRIVLIYGDCCNQMSAFESMPFVARTHGKNCFELLLGSQEYRRLSHEGAFFLLSEWTRRWKDVFEKELGLSHDNATCLMQEMHKKLVYLDTNLTAVPEKDLKECAQYCGLPVETLQVSLNTLCSTIEGALLRCNCMGARI